jgi:hypothetical protein
MTQASVNLSIPFEALVEVVQLLSDEQKSTLRQVLDHGSESLADSKPDQSWSDLLTFIDEAAIDTGIEDLASQHDHYIHGTLKRKVRL